MVSKREAGDCAGGKLGTVKDNRLRQSAIDNNFDNLVES